jgi:hypothetical protein
MTSHELAAILLAGPNEVVGYYKYMGGEDEFRDIKSVVQEDDAYTGKAIVLHTYTD